MISRAIGELTSQLALPADYSIPQLRLPDEAASVRFRVSGDMVARFAALTGDRSSLHVDDAMARRSAYRRPIVHGMLPVAFLALSPHFRIDGFCCSLIAMSGRFIAPVYVGDRLLLTTRVTRGGAERQVGFGYRIENEVSGAAVVTGEMTVEYRSCAVTASHEPLNELRGGDSAATTRWLPIRSRHRALRPRRAQAPSSLFAGT